MSYDLYVFHSTETQTNQSAAALFEGFVAREAVSRPEVAAFTTAFLNGAREIEKPGPEEPWPGEFEASADGICLHLAAGAHSDITELIISLADKYGLFLFDPQMGEIITGPDYVDANVEDLSGGCAALSVILGIILSVVAGVGYWLFS